MKVHYIACAKSSSVDGQSNQLSLFHVLDEIAGSVYPLHLSSFCVASLFEREPDDNTVQSFVLAISLDASLLASFTMSVDFAPSRRSRSVNTIQGLTIPAPGLVTVRIMQKAKVLAEWRALAIQFGASGGTPKAAPAKPTDPSEPSLAPPKGISALN